MKKKVFIPCSIGFILLNCFFLSLSIISILAIVQFIEEEGVSIYNLKSIINILILCAALIFLFYTTIRFFLAFKIHIWGDSIFAFGDLLPKRERIQYKCTVKYAEIESVQIIASSKDSRGQSIQLNWVSSGMPKKYLLFNCINNHKKRICINYYTKKQVIKMLSYINQNMIASNCEHSIDVDEVMKDWYAYGGYNKKQGKKNQSMKEKGITKQSKKSEILSEQTMEAQTKTTQDGVGIKKDEN